MRYTLSDGLHIAYQVTGDTTGRSADIVLISGFVSHLELDWEDPRHTLFLRRLGRMGRLIRFDKRGTGMSDRPSQPGSGSPADPPQPSSSNDQFAEADASERPGVPAGHFHRRRFALRRSRVTY